MKIGRKQWISFTDDFARKYPAVLMFSAVCAVCIPGLLLKQTGFSVFYTVFIALCGLAGFGVLCCSVRNLILRLLIPGCLAACSICYHNHALQQEPLLKALRGESGCGEGIFRITDDALATDLPFLYPRRRIQAELLKFRPAPTENWQNIKAKVTFLLSKEDYEKWNCGYDDELIATGSFLRHSPQIDPEGFDFRQWQERQKIFYEFRADQVKILRTGKGYYRFLYDMRNRLLKRICAHIPDPEIKALIPGLFFGLRSADPETLKDFRASGMIHIISVSGTHISLFALVLFLIFAPIPYKIRYMIVILLTFLYAESTGMRLPAFRAFLMFALFCGLRVFHLRTLTLNTLFLAAVLFTLWDPSALLQAGFQFSFLAVAALLQLTAWQKHYAPPETARMLLTPSRMISPQYVWMARIKHKLLLLVLSCLTAWLISLPLTIYHQGMWSTGGPAANLFSAPLITLSFLFFAGCCFFCLVTPLLIVFARMLTLCLQGVCAIAGMFADSSAWMMRPALWIVLLFIGMILLFLSGRRKMTLYISALLICTLLFLWNWQRIHRTPEVLLFTDGTRYSLCIHTPDNRSIKVISLPDKSFAYNILQSCTTRQIERCELLFIPKMEKYTQDALHHLNGKIPVLQYAGAKPDGKRNLTQTFLPLEKMGTFHILRANALNGMYWENRLYIQHRDNAGGTSDLFLRQADHAIMLKIKRHNGAEKEYKIPADGKGIRLFRASL
jgi:ComEC/Rec2-related protein